jgi:hypothetical protein
MGDGKSFFKRHCRCIFIVTILHKTISNVYVYVTLRVVNSNFEVVEMANIATQV